MHINNSGNHQPFIKKGHHIKNQHLVDLFYNEKGELTASWVIFFLTNSMGTALVSFKTFFFFFFKWLLSWKQQTEIKTYTILALVSFKTFDHFHPWFWSIETYTSWNKKNLIFDPPLFHLFNFPSPFPSIDDSSRPHWYFTNLSLKTSLACVTIWPHTHTNSWGTFVRYLLSITSTVK